MRNICPCCTGKSYEQCCKVFHEGTYPKNALQLMRSRYSAYAYNKADYIIKTTHPSNPHYKENHQQWKSEILHFCQHTTFEGLEILEFEDGNHQAYVTFLAKLKQGKSDISFKEKSYFEKIGPQWLYKEAIFLQELQQ